MLEVILTTSGKSGPGAGAALLPAAGVVSIVSVDGLLGLGFLQSLASRRVSSENESGN